MLIKYLDLLIIFTLYFILASIASLIINRMWFYDFDPKTNKLPTIVILLQVIIEVVITGFVGHHIRLLISSIPFPYLDKNYSREGLVEISGGVVFAFSVLSFQINLKNKTMYLFKKFQKKEQSFFLNVFGKNPVKIESKKNAEEINNSI